jgi:hypothetical protein
MAIYAGVDTFWQAKRGIVQDGLVLNLDAGVTQSYPGAGTTWTDLSGNGNNGTLINGPTFISDNGGGIVFDGTNDYVYSNISSNNTSYSLSLALKINAFTSSDMRICGAVSGSTSQFALGFTSTVFRIWVGNSWRNTSSTFNTGIYYLVDIVNLSNSTTVYVNSNSVLNTVGYNSFSNLGFGSNFLLGYGTYFNGFISYIKLYNRALSANEVQQNFNVTRKRFGI